jgi:hypothetical protein
MGRLLPVDYWEVQFSALETARQETALFLHHDAITGTSRTNVVHDYLERMQRASQKIQLMMANMIQHLITKPDHPTPLLTAHPYTIDIADAEQTGIQEVGNGDDQPSPLPPLYSPIVLFNSLAWSREELVTVKVGTRHVLVYNHQGERVRAQVSRTERGHDHMPIPPPQALRYHLPALSLSLTRRSLPPLLRVHFLRFLPPA